MNNKGGRVFHLTDTQYAYLLGRNMEFKGGGISTHAYYEFKNMLELQRFERALNDVIAHHGMLRTIILPSGMHKELSAVPYYHMEFTDFCQCTEEEIQQEILKKRQKYSHYVFSTDQWPLFKVESFKLPAGENYMFLSIDLLIADGSSIRIFIRDIVNRYLNPTMQLPEQEGDFYEFIREMDGLQAKPIYKKSVKYWKDKIVEMPFAPRIPQKRDAVSSSRFSRLAYHMLHEKWERLKEIIQQKNNIPTVVLCTAFAKVLSYWCSQSHFTLNVTLSNRGRGQMKYANTIGDFTSLMLMEIQDDMGDDFWTSAEKLKKSFMKAYMYNSYDGLKVARDAARYHNMEGEVLFPVVFTSLIGGEIGKTLQPIMGEMKYSISQTPQVYLDFQVSEMKNQLHLTWDFLEDRFDYDMMRIMFEQMCQILNKLVDEGTCNTAEIVKPSKDLENTVQNYNAVKKVFEEKHTLQSLLEKSFEQHRDSMALKDDHTSLTYGELNEKSACVANTLAANGVGRGDCVAVEGIRCVETVIKIIGIIRAGASYVPLNPKDPDERKKYIMEQSGCKQYLDGSWTAETYGEKRIWSKSEPEDTAYYIFTSGSTGKPKGVIISNHAVCNTLLDMNEHFKITENDSVLNVSSYNFDLSVYDIFGILMVGAMVYVAADARESAKLVAILEKEKITIWNSVPAIFELAMHEAGSENQLLRYVFLSGDWIPLNLFEEMKKNFPKTQLISLGGATEASIWSIYYPVTEVKAHWRSIPYGYPLANQSIYVLDEHLRLCPFEVSGMIYIGGQGIADGYLKEAELTRNAFIEHPVYGRLYKTGDLGIFCREGYVDILGRADFQVKLNGYRIELEEIRNAVEESALVQRAEITVETIQDKKILCGYILPDKQATVEHQDIQAVLERVSADYPIPQQLASDEYNGSMSKLNKIAVEVMKMHMSTLLQKTKVPCEMTFDEFMRISKVQKKYSKLMREWLMCLSEVGWIKVEGEHYVITESIAFDKNRISEEVEKATKYSEVLLTYLLNCMLHTVEILRGEDHVLKYLFPEGSETNAEMLYKNNPLSRYINDLAAEIIHELVSLSDEKINILEVGAGIGGTSVSVLEKIKKENIEYTFTDISSYFTDSAKMKFRDYSFMKYGFYNINEKYQSQNLSPESYSIILAVNVIHDAARLPETLKDLYSMLKPNGCFVLVELTENMPLLCVTGKLMDGYQDYEDFRVEDGHVLLTPEQWEMRLQDAGFTAIRVLPQADGERRLGEYVIIAQKKPVYQYLTQREICEIEQNLKEKLPEYMVPHEWIQISEMPLSANGKVDKKALPKPYVPTGETRIIKEPQTKLQEQLLQIWKEILNTDRISIDDTFFRIGGDSVLMLKVLGKIKQTLHVSVPFEVFMEHSTIEALEKFISK